MDPLTIATGVLTLMGACNALGSTVQKLYHLRNGPKEISELSSDISALKSCVENVNQLVQAKGGDLNRTISTCSLESCVENARKKVEQTQAFLEHSLLDDAAVCRVRARALLRWQSHFSRLRQELRDVRSELGTCIGLYNV